MPLPPISALLTVAMTLMPFGSAQQARLAAWLNWGAAYRNCWEPAPFSLGIDETFTAHCIEAALRERRGDTPEQRAATDALIAATPQLIAMLNTAVAEPSPGKQPTPIDPPADR